MTFSTLAGIRRAFAKTCFLALVASASVAQAQAPAEPVRRGDTVRYQLTISEAKLNITGKPVTGMVINGGIPGPTLRFRRGDYAVMEVTNAMDVGTSIHWHGLIPPNLYDGVPYLTTPPIEPGETFVYQFRLHQDGTYWYHSHTALQEQSGVLGAIVIEPEAPPVDYDSDLVIALSDWTNERPEEQLRTLKRGSEWYAVKRGTTQPWNKVLARGAGVAKLKFAWQRMTDMQLSDNYFDAFLLNGAPAREYPRYKPGERVRVRIVNAAAATYFWLTWGGATPTLFSSDGLDVVPVPHEQTLIGVSETYDFIVTVPASGRIELLATSMDGSGSASAFIGEGETLAAKRLPKPDLIEMMQEMMAMNMKMGAPSTEFRPGHRDSMETMRRYAMDMDGMDMGDSDDTGSMDTSASGEKDSHKGGMHHAHRSGKHGADGAADSSAKAMPAASMDMDNMKMGSAPESSASSGGNDDMAGMGMSTEADNDSLVQIPAMAPAGLMPGGNQDFNYDYLRSKTPTVFADTLPVKEMLFNLTGNMARYTWSINGVPVSETDKIEIRRGEVVRITMNNLTMMHHPMHLHGHYFRVLNANGDYSPLKHTVNVAPMQKVTIEFYANEYNDWFFHCHVLYHINSGMARVFSYGDDRNEELDDYPLANLTTEANRLWTWGRLTAASHASYLYATTTNLRNQFSVNGEYGWNQNLEAEATYERYLTDYFRVFGGVNVENTTEGSMDDLTTTAIGGVRVLLPSLIRADLRLDSKLRPQIGLTGEAMLFPRITLDAEFEYQADFKLLNESAVPELPTPGYEDELTWALNLNYILAKNWLVTAGYDNWFGAGAGVTIRL